MRPPRIRLLMTLCAIALGVVVIGAAPAVADVDCSDLKSRGAAQSYLEGRPGDLDGLDADGDGQACEANDPRSYGEWTLPGLAVLLLGALVVNGVVAKRQARTRFDQPLPLQPPVPVQRSGEVPAHESGQKSGQKSAQKSGQKPDQVPDPVIVAAPGSKQAMLEAAPDGSLEELARALRLVPAGKRMSLVELYAIAHHAAPQEVLGALVAEVDDVGLRRWASAGYRSTGRETLA